MMIVELRLGWGVKQIAKKGKKKGRKKTRKDMAEREVGREWYETGEMSTENEF